MKSRNPRPAVLCPAVLCIGGLDPSGGAGLLADVEAVRAAGGRALAVATALTVQSRRGVFDVAPVSAAFLVAQVERLFEDEKPAAVKLGMLGNAAVAGALTRCLTKRLGRRPLVIDPVLRSTSGRSLFRGRADRDYARLFAMARVVTPNLPEAERFLSRDIGSWRPERELAGRDLQALAGCAIVLKGGHASGDADDLIVDGRAITWLTGKRVATFGRGTGCRFASALATRLALGDSLVQASRAAKRYVRQYLSAPHPTLPRKRGRSLRGR